MRFLVVGPGAMGCLFAARLTKAGFGVSLLDYSRERAELISRQGIRVEGVTGEYTVPVPASSGKGLETPDVVLICVKAHQTRRAAEDLRAWLGPGAWILTLQNGLGNLEVLEDL